MKTKKSEKLLPLPDQHQSAWQLAAIQLSGWTSLPILATSIIILENNSFLGAILTLILGNAILWFIRLGILAMSHQERQSTLDLACNYMGRYSNYFIAILLLTSTFAWFITQTRSASSSITQLLPLNEGPDVDQFMQVSVFFGVASTLFCMGGIVLLRKLCVFLFPILTVGFFALVYVLSGKISYAAFHPLSLSGLTLVLATNLGITADLPTFFRHSKSWNTTVKALTLIQIISLTIGICSLYLSPLLSSGFEHNQITLDALNSPFLRAIAIAFIFLSVICANVANVYSASIGWELVAPKALVGRKEMLILGLGLTTIFILVVDLFSLEFLLNFSDSSLVNLSIVLLLGYIITRQQKRLPSRFEQLTYFTAWLFSTLVNLFQFLELWLVKYSYVGVGATTIGCVILFAFLARDVKRQISRG